MTDRETLDTSDLAGRAPASEDEPISRDTAATAQDADTDQPLLPQEQGQEFDTRWEEIQAAFVDEPRDAVQRADQLVAELMQRLAADFAETRSQLESQWDSGDDVSTEDLRVALTRYRSFFRRLLSA